jgi:hypothetical protein
MMSLKLELWRLRFGFRGCPDVFGLWTWTASSHLGIGSSVYPDHTAMDRTAVILTGLSLHLFRTRPPPGTNCSRWSYVSLLHREVDRGCTGSGTRRRRDGHDVALRLLLLWSVTWHHR